MLHTCGKSFEVILYLMQGMGYTLYLSLYWVLRTLMAFTAVLEFVYLSTHIEGMFQSSLYC